LFLGGADYCGLGLNEFLTGHEWEKALVNPSGVCQTGMASFCKAPPTAEQLGQQQLEEGQTFKQQGLGR